MIFRALLSSFVISHSSFGAPLPLPLFTPAGGTYVTSANTDSRQVQISTAERGVCVAYTVDGSGPTRAGGCNPFGAMVTLPLGRTVLKAIQCDATRCSSVRSNTYTINQPAAKVVHSPIVKLYWTSEPDARVTSYIVRYGPGSAIKESKEVTGTEASITIDAPGIWTFIVTACDGTGAESPASNHIRVNYKP